jgi:hypothetical protein
MLLPRIIPCLLLTKEGLVKTVNFKNPTYIGDPVNAVKIFNEKEADELCFLDITATNEKREPNYKVISEIASECFMPLSYGGGINNFEQAKKKGITKIICVSVNDPNVMKAWGENQNVGNKIFMAADPYCEFTKSIGAVIDRTENGLGVRSARYTMLAENNVIRKIKLEEDASQCEISAAKNFIKEINSQYSFNNKIIDDNWLNAYSSQFPDRASCLGAINFPLDALLNRIVPFIVEGFKEGDFRGLCSKPAILAYGMQDKAIDPDYAIRDFKALFPESKVTKIQNAGHYSQEDEPQILIDLIKKFMKDNEI